MLYGRERTVEQLSSANDQWLGVKSFAPLLNRSKARLTKSIFFDEVGSWPTTTRPPFASGAADFVSPSLASSLMAPTLADNSVGAMVVIAFTQVYSFGGFQLVNPSPEYGTTE